MQVKYLPVSGLKPHARNPRTHSPKQVRQIAESIRKFGFVNPILIDGDGGVIAGHGRIEAAKLLGIDRCRRSPGPHDRGAKARLHHDRQQARRERRWDQELLALELQYIAELDIDFDLTITGFETAEIDFLLSVPDTTGGMTKTPTRFRNSIASSRRSAGRRSLDPGTASPAMRRRHQRQIH